MNLIKEKKLEKLYSFLVKHGFEVTIEAITEGIDISKKTFFNRYQNRDNMEKIVQNYWRQKFKIRFEQKSALCNNGVEVLLLFIYELLLSNKNEYFFIQQEIKNENYLSDNQEDNFINIIKKIINNNNYANCFRKDVNIDLYAHFFIYNIFHLYLTNSHIDFIEFLLLALFSNEGKEMLEDVNLEMMFTIS